jgi:hypothetical protein
MLNDDPRAMSVLVTTYLPWRRNEGNAFIHCILTADSHGCIHWTFSWNNRMLNGVPKHHQERKLHGEVRVLWKSFMSCSSAKMDLHCINPRQLVQWSVANITIHSCRIRWGGSSPLTTRTAGAWCHFVQGQCNTCHFLSKRNIW